MAVLLAQKQIKTSLVKLIIVNEDINNESTTLILNMLEEIKVFSSLQNLSLIALTPEEEIVEKFN